MSDLVRPTSKIGGSPYEPVGDPMLTGVGPAAWANRPDTPDLTVHGTPKIVPIAAANFHLGEGDPDPRGLPVIGCDKQVAGKVVDIWVDRSEPQVRYLEVAVTATGKNVLLPITNCRFDYYKRDVYVHEITSAQFAHVPVTKKPGVVTLLEEDKIMAYYVGGRMYATPDRAGPVF